MPTGAPFAARQSMSEVPLSYRCFPDVYSTSDRAVAYRRTVNAHGQKGRLEPTVVGSFCNARAGRSNHVMETV